MAKKQNVEIIDAKTFKIPETEVKKYSPSEPFKILIPAWLGNMIKDKKIEVLIKVKD